MTLEQAEMWARGEVHRALSSLIERWCSSFAHRTDDLSRSQFVRMAEDDAHCAMHFRRITQNLEPHAHADRLILFEGLLKFADRAIEDAWGRVLEQLHEPMAKRFRERARKHAQKAAQAAERRGFSKRLLC